MRRFVPLAVVVLLVASAYPLSQAQDAKPPAAPDRVEYNLFQYIKGEEQAAPKATPGKPLTPAESNQRAKAAREARGRLDRAQKELNALGAKGFSVVAVIEDNDSQVVLLLQKGGHPPAPADPLRALEGTEEALQPEED